MTLHTALEKILTEWNDEKDKPFKNNQLAIYIRSEFPRIVSKILRAHNGKFTCTASPGAGNWAQVPWLSILHPDITKSTQNGIYPVYLFRSDGTGVYLSLNQGTTTPTEKFGKKQAQERALGIATYVRKQCPELEKWETKSLELHSSSTLGKSYELPNIASRFYPINDIPDNQTLTNDLEELLSVYKKIADKKIWGDITSKRLDELLPEPTSSSDKKIALPETITALSKPFLLLAGISGTGKTRFVREQAQRYDASLENYCLVPVRPDWHEPSDLLGYVSRINGTRYIISPFLKFMIKAWRDAIEKIEGQKIVLKSFDQVTPFWLCLDEMNLAPVEQYFADYLSIVETRKWENNTYTCDPILKKDIFEDLQSYSFGRQEETTNALECFWDEIFAEYPDATSEFATSMKKYFSQNGISIPPNLIVAGTVNMDETTYGFSRKVIDRALTVDFGEFFPNDYDDFFVSKTLPKTFTFPSISHVTEADVGSIPADPGGVHSIAFLKAINDIVKNTPFELAYRALNELLLSLVSFMPADTETLCAIWDDFLMQKVLPRIEGDMAKLRSLKNSRPVETLDEKIFGKGSLLHDLYRLLSDETQPWDICGKESRPDLLREAVDAQKELPAPLRIEWRTKKKLEWMMKRLKTNHFTDFWV